MIPWFLAMCNDCLFSLLCLYFLFQLLLTMALYLPLLPLFISSMAYKRIFAPPSRLRKLRSWLLGRFHEAGVSPLDSARRMHYS